MCVYANEDARVSIKCGPKKLNARNIQIVSLIQLKSRYAN